MSKRKKPEFETLEQESIWDMKDSISNHATKSEKNTWARKRKNIELLVEQVQPIEREIMVLTAKAMPIHDDINRLRQDMVANCVHPFDLLEYKGNVIHCKFCDAKLSVKKSK